VPSGLTFPFVAQFNHILKPGVIYHDRSAFQYRVASAVLEAQSVEHDFGHAHFDQLAVIFGCVFGKTVQRFPDLGRVFVREVKPEFVFQSSLTLHSVYGL
jgi:hypothetical protein